MLWTAIITAVAAQVTNFPTKSVNMASADAVEYYHVFDTSATLVDDAHAVAGAPTSDGGYVVVGKGLESDGSSVSEAFALKFTSAGSLQWSYKSSHSGDDAFNAVIQLPSGGDLIAIGYRSESGVYRRMVTQLGLTSGTAGWVGTAFGDSAGAHGGYENVELSVDGSTLYAGGFTGKPNTE